MSIPIKIECSCGQHYAFEVEPVNGRVPAPVACPSCGAEGTETANVILAQILQSQPTAPAPLRVTALPRTHTPSAPDHRGASLLPGQTTRTQAQHEARAKILWGDPPLQVQAYLMTQGYNREEAAAVVQEFLQERIRTIRLKGIKYMCLGGVLLGAAALSFLLCYLNHHWPRSRAIGLLGVVGLFGAGLLLKGLTLVLTPKSESGDASAEVDTGALFD